MSGTRLRSEDHRSQTYVHQHSNVYGWDVTTPANTAGRSTSISEAYQDNWRKLINSGQVFVNAMERTIWERTASSGTTQETSPYYTQGPVNTYSGDIAGLVRNSTSHISLNYDQGNLAAAEANAILDAMAKANGSESFAGETLVQLGQTVSMLKRPLSGVTRLLRKTSRRQRQIRVLRPALTEAQALASAHLELRYGWKPLIMDLELIMNSIIGLHQQLKRRVIVRGSATVPSLESEIPYQVNLPGDFFRWEASGVVNRSETIRAHAGVIIDVIPMSTLDMVMKVFGFRGRDLPATLWALTPLSFVCDWFFNFEQWLTAIIPDPTVTVRASWVTSTTNVKLDYSGGTIVGHPWGPYVTELEGYYSPSSIISTKIRRTPNPSLPSTPVLTTELLSLTHQVDAVALITGSITKKLLSMPIVRPT